MLVSDAADAEVAAAEWTDKMVCILIVRSDGIHLHAVAHASFKRVKTFSADLAVLMVFLRLQVVVKLFCCREALRTLRAWPICNIVHPGWFIRFRHLE